MNTKHWKKVLRQSNGSIEKVLPSAVPGKLDGTFITKPMKSETVAKVIDLRTKLGYKS